MNSDELDKLICKNDLEECVVAFSKLAEKERKVLAERASQWNEIGTAFDQATNWMIPFWEQNQDQLPKTLRNQIALVKKVKNGEIKIPDKVSDSSFREMVRLVLTATAGLTDLRKLPLPSPAHAFEIMRDRKPNWLDRWLNLACQRAPHVVFEMVRAFEKDGIKADRDEGYWLAMALTLGQKDAEALLKELRADDELREQMLWQMLESDEAIRVISDPSGINEQLRRSRRSRSELDDWRHWGQRLQESRHASYIWKLVLSELASNNEISQTKLTDVIFTWVARLSGDAESKASSAMAGELSPAGWFQALYEELKFDRCKKSELADRYIGLLAMKDTSTLTWSLQNLSDCEAGELPVDDLLANITRVFYLKRKEPAATALKLIEQLMLKEAISKTQAAQVVVEAFEHSSSDIQKKALSFLKKSKTIEDPYVLQGLNDRLERMNALVKKEVLETSAKYSAAPTCESQAEGFSSQERVDLAGLIEQAKQLDPGLADLAGVGEMLKALSDGASVPGALGLDSMDIPRLDPSKKIVPLDNLDDLIFSYLHVLEGSAGADEVERLLDGIMRLCDQRPADFENRVSSLRKKIKPTVELLERKPPIFQPFTGQSPIMDLHSLAIGWLDSKDTSVKKADFLDHMKAMFKVAADGIQDEIPEFLKSAIGRTFEMAPALSFFSQRVQGLLPLVAKRRPLPLLAAPTHQGGWIDPLVLPERLAAWKAAGVARDKADVIQTMLRLAPQHRLEALAQMPAGNDEDIRAIRYALGDEMKAPFSSPEIWVAAFRCREPRGTNTFLKERFPDLGPDSAVPAVYVENMDGYKKRPDGIFGVGWQREWELLPIESKPDFKYRSNIRLFPLELMHEKNVLWEGGSNLLEYYFPLERESFFAYLTRRMAVYIDSQGTYWQTSWNTTFDPDVRLNGMASWFLLLALSAKQQEMSRLALDATICGIEDGRLDGISFGAKMARVFASEKITLSRWVNALREISRISPLHNYFIVQTLEECLANISLEYCFKPPLPLIELLYEASLSCAYVVENESARKFLSKVQGKGKGAKLSKLILDLPKSARTDSNRRAVLVQILEARIQRAERWQSCRSNSNEQVASQPTMGVHK